jgi:hypothetical protein
MTSDSLIAPRCACRMERLAFRSKMPVDGGLHGAACAGLARNATCGVNRLPAEFAASIENQRAKIAPIARALGIKPKQAPRDPN